MATDACGRNAPGGGAGKPAVRGFGRHPDGALACEGRPAVLAASLSRMLQRASQRTAKMVKLKRRPSSSDDAPGPGRKSRDTERAHASCVHHPRRDRGGEILAEERSERLVFPRLPRRTADQSLSRQKPKMCSAALAIGRDGWPGGVDQAAKIERRDFVQRASTRRENRKPCHVR